MPTELAVLVTALLTLLYCLIGLRAMLHIDATFGARYLPETRFGTWAGLALWPLAWIVAAVRFRSRCNRRVLS